MKIAILTPSRQRPGKLDRLIDSVYETASKKNSIRMYNYIDTDDPRIKQYRNNEKNNVFPHLLDVGLTVFNVYDKPQSVSKSWNVLAEKAMYESKEWGADVLIMGNDDQVYKTKDWDIILQKELEQFDDDIYCCWFEDLINGKSHCAFPIVSSKWYETLGYFTPGVFHFGYNDTWVYDIAKRIDRCHFIPEVVVEHLHFSTGKVQMDVTYNRNRTEKRGNLYHLDKVIFDETEDQREQAAEKLRKCMNEFNGSVTLKSIKSLKESNNCSYGIMPHPH